MSDLVSAYVIPIVAVFIASATFSVFYNVRKSSIIYCALGGAIGWTTYLLFSNNIGHKYVSFFIAAMAITLFAEIVSRIKNVPVTIFLTISLFPLVPGKPIFNTIESLLSVDKSGFVSWGMETFMTVIAIAIGVILVSSLFRLTAKLKESIYLSKNNKA